MTQKPSYGDEDPEKQLKLHVFMVSLMKSGHS